LDYLSDLYKTSTRKGVRKLILWALSNICAGPIRHIQIVLNSDVFNRLIEAMDDSCFNIRRESIRVISNITSNQDLETNILLLSNGTVEKLYIKLNETNDSELILMILHITRDFLVVSKYLEEGMGDFTIRHEIEKFNGLGIIQKFTTHSDMQVMNAALVVMNELNNIKQIS
jgi:hypothetical protein